VWVPKPVRGILGKSELWKNLYTTDLAEANTKKHRVVENGLETEFTIYDDSQRVAEAMMSI
jgi:hypothetical protein